MDIQIEKSPEIYQGGAPGIPGARHVGIIMDGNGRWAQKQGVARLVGHRAGARRVQEIVEACHHNGIEYLTIFAFSTENWKRTTTEVSGLMALFCEYIERKTQALYEGGVCVRFIGDRASLKPQLRDMMDMLEEKTWRNTSCNLTIALNYGARDEIRRATMKLARDVAAGLMGPETITDQTLRAYLDTHFLPDPDLIIRTGGEVRLSNFLLLQSAYAEYEFVNTLWPDFTRVHFEEILDRFVGRTRRFGDLPLPGTRVEMTGA